MTLSLPLVCRNYALNGIGTDVQGGKLVVTKVATVLLALMSDESVGFGMLKAKVCSSHWSESTCADSHLLVFVVQAEAIVSYLGEPLSKVDMMDNE